MPNAQLSKLNLLAGRLPEASALSAGTARRAVRGGFGETALPVATRLYYNKTSKLQVKT